MKKIKSGLFLLLAALSVGGSQIQTPRQNVSAQLAAGLVEAMDYSTTHAFIRTKTGELHTVGNSSKRPMIVTGDRYDTPFNVSSTTSLNFLAGQTIDKFALGYDTTMLLTTTGNVFTSGGNSEGQWGQGTTETFGRARPENITSNFTTLSPTDRIVDIYASTTNPVVHMARSLEGKIYVWGANPHAEDTSYASTNFTGKSGSGLTNTLSITTPLDITDLFLEMGEASVTHIAFTAHGGVALTNSQFMYTWGVNNDGMLAIGNPDQTFVSATPTKVDLSSILEAEETLIGLSTSSIFSSGDFVNQAVATTSSGRIILWGMNSYGLVDEVDLIGDAKFVGSPIVVDTSDIVLEPDETIIQTLSLHGLYALTNLGRVFTRGGIALVSLANFMTVDDINVYLQNPEFIDQTSQFPVLPEGDFIKVLHGIERSFVAISDQGHVMTARGGFAFENSFKLSSGGSSSWLHGLTPGLRYNVYIGERNTPYENYAIGDTFTLPAQPAQEGFYQSGWSYNADGFPLISINFQFTFSGSSHIRIFPVFVEGVDPTISSSSEVASSTPTSTPTESTSSDSSTSVPITSEPDTPEPPAGPRPVNPAAIIVTTVAVAGVGVFSYFFFFRGLAIGGFSFVALKAWFLLLLKRKKEKDDDKKK